jgi:hypothetical protein
MMSLESEDTQMKTNDKSVKAIAKAAFADYTGRKFFFEVQKRGLDCRSFWQDGSRDYFRFVRLADNAVSVEVPSQSGFDRPINGLESVIVPEGFVCVRHSFFCGQDCGLTVIANPANVTALLPVAVL